MKHDRYAALTKRERKEYLRTFNEYRKKWLDANPEQKQKKADRARARAAKRKAEREAAQCPK